MTQFQIGDKAVYPAQGVTEIVGIETKEIMGTKQDFYVLRVLDSEKKIMIPVDKVESVGLREVISPDRLKEVYTILKTRDIQGGGGNWNRRYRAYIDKIKTGSAIELAEVLRDLNVLKYDKNLSFGERKMLDTARRLLVQEMAVAEGISETEMDAQVEGFFAG